MLTEKDKVEQFKRELKSYEFYKKKVQECNEQLEEIAVKLQGVSSPAIKDVIYENAGNPYRKDSRILELMNDEDRLIDERQRYIDNVLYIENALFKIPNPNERKMIEDVFIRRVRHEKVAMDNGYTRMGMHKRINVVIASII